MEFSIDNLKIGQYIYQKRGRNYRIYVKSGKNRLTPLVDETFLNREEARKRVYELNGWKE